MTTKAEKAKPFDPRALAVESRDKGFAKLLKEWYPGGVNREAQLEGQENWFLLDQDTILPAVIEVIRHGSVVPEGQPVPPHLNQKAEEVLRWKDSPGWDLALKSFDTVTTKADRHLPWKVVDPEATGTAPKDMTDRQLRGVCLELARKFYTACLHATAGQTPSRMTWKPGNHRWKL